MRLEGLSQLKKSNDLVGNGSAQPTTLSHAPRLEPTVSLKCNDSEGSLMNIES
jgi:hypothetical protein